MRNEHSQRLPSRTSLARLAGPAVLVVVAALAYSGTLHAPFIFDDYNAIVENPHVRSLLPLGRSLTAPSQSTVAGRPVVALTLAVNYAVSGADPWSYHLVNTLIHLLAGLALYGIVRRTLAGPGLASVPRRPGPGWALAVAAVWVLHPLHTEAVTYVSTRTESLVGLFYLLALYSLIRSADSPRPAAWWAACVAATTLAMGTKEVAVTIPVVLLAYDAVFLSTGVRDALRRRHACYLGLAATWLLLAALLAGSPRGDTVGFDFPELRPLEYLRTQAGVIWHYLRLAVWPHPLALDYAGWPIARGFTPAVAAPVLTMAALAALSLWMLWRRSWLGFVGFAFFAILAPTSSVVPIVSEVVAERRMYLPLAAVVVLVLAGLWKALDRLWPARRDLAFAALAAGIAVALGVATVARNRVYGSEVSIWQDTVRTRPDNPRAIQNLGTALARAGRHAEAAEQFRRSLEIDAGSALALEGLGGSMIQLGRREEGIAQIQRALEVDPSATRALENLGLIRLEEGNATEAVRLLSRCAELRPEDGLTRVNLAKALLVSGDADGAQAALVQAVSLAPESAVAHARLAWLLAERGRPDDAAPHVQRALQLDPGDVSVKIVAGHVALRRGALDEAIRHYRVVVAKAPDDPEGLLGLAVALQRGGAPEEAASVLDRLAHAMPEARRLVPLADRVFASLDPSTGVDLLRAAVRLNPSDPDLRLALGRQLAAAQRAREALAEHREALRLRPQWGDAGNSLALLLATADDPAVRDPDGALRIAGSLVKASGGTHPVLLGTFGVALASAGRRGEAEQVLTEAVGRARAGSQPALAVQLERHLAMVRQGWPAPPRVSPDPGRASVAAAKP